MPRPNNQSFFPICLFLCILFVTEISKAATCSELSGASVYSQESTPVYLGFFGSAYASESIMNVYGTYGSEYNTLSVRNDYGRYGSEYMSYSANNQYTSTPPKIYKNGALIAYLTANPYIYGGVSLSTIDASCTFYSSTPIVTTYQPPLLPNLTTYTPDGWSNALVASIISGTSATASTFTDQDVIYIDWAILNDSTTAISVTFSTGLYIDGTLQHTWTTSSLQANYYTSLEDYPIGPLSPGIHEIKIVTDTGSTVQESDGSDNSYSRTISVIAQSAAVAPPTITVPASDADGNYTVSWAASTTPGVTYSLWEKAMDQDFSTGVEVYYGTGTSFNIGGRESGKTYYYTVSASKNGYLDSSWTFGSNGCVVSMPTGSPQTIIVPSSDTDGSYTVSWTAAATNGASYTLEEATNSGFTSGLRTAYGGTDLSSNIISRPSGTTYYYRVRAIKTGYTNSVWTTGGNGCAVIVPAVNPANMVVPRLDADGSYNITWTASSTPGASYTLEEATNSGFTAGLRTVYSGSDLVANITGRSTETTYYYRVKATKSGYTDSNWTIGANGCTVNIPSTVTATIGIGGSVTPSSLSVINGSNAIYTVSANRGYTKSNTVGGTCPAGSWNGDIYETGAINSNCSVSFIFTQNPIAIPARGTCATVDSNLNIDIPCVNVGGEYYQVTLIRYQKPNDPFTFYWSLGEVIPESDNGDCASVNLATMAVNLPCVNVSETEYSVDFNQYVNTADPFQFYWSLGAVQDRLQ